MMATYRVRGWSLDAWGFQGQTDAPRWSFRHDVTRLRRRPHARGRTGNKALRSGSESGSGSFARPGPSHGRLPAGWLLLACRVLYAVFGSLRLQSAFFWTGRRQCQGCPRGRGLTGFVVRLVRPPKRLGLGPCQKTPPMFLSPIRQERFSPVAN
jgi:hypothetical protein